MTRYRGVLSSLEILNRYYPTTHFDQHLHRFFCIKKPYVRRFSIFLYGKKKKLISLTHYKLKRVNLFRSLNNQVDSPPHSVLQITSHTILFSTYKFDEIIEFNRKIRKKSSCVEPDLADTPWTLVMISFDSAL